MQPSSVNTISTMQSYQVMAETDLCQNEQGVEPSEREGRSVLKRQEIGPDVVNV